MQELPPDFPIPAAHASIPAHVVYRAFAAETVILNLETGKYHGLNRTGGRMLELLDRCGSVCEALKAFAAGQVEQDLRAFCRRLHERGLIEITLDAAC